MAEDPSPAPFRDGKDPAALRTIGEISAALGIKQHVLRYWEQQFPMLSPLKRSGGRRYYRTEDVALVAAIDRLINREGYTLKGARQALERSSAPVPGDTAPPVAAHADAGPAAPASGSSVPSSSAAADLLPRLHAIRARLAEALAG